MTLLKSIVAALVLANVAYFLWARGIAATPDAVIATPSLMLASEAPGVVTRGGQAQAVLTQPDAVAPPGEGASGEAAAPPADSVINGGETTAVAPPEKPRRCASVGPFREVSEAARVAGTLRMSGYDPRQRVADGEVWAGVWVYVPLSAAPAAAEQTLEKLKAGGIDDAMEMPGPNDTSVISLGLFSEQKRAQARVAQAQALALEPAVMDRKRNGSVYWIDIDLKPTQVALNPADLQGEAGHIVRLEVRTCAAAGAR